MVRGAAERIGESAEREEDRNANDEGVDREEQSNSISTGNHDKM